MNCPIYFPFVSSQVHDLSVSSLELPRFGKVGVGHIIFPLAPVGYPTIEEGTGRIRV